MNALSNRIRERNPETCHVVCTNAFKQLRHLRPSSSRDLKAPITVTDAASPENPHVRKSDTALRLTIEVSNAVLALPGTSCIFR